MVDIQTAQTKGKIKTSIQLTLFLSLCMQSHFIYREHDWRLPKYEIRPLFDQILSFQEREYFFIDNSKEEEKFWRQYFEFDMPYIKNEHYWQEKFTFFQQMDPLERLLLVHPIF